MSTIVKAVQQAIQDADNIQALVAEGVIGKDSGWVNGWIFDSALSVRMESTQKCAIVVSYGGGWLPPLEDGLTRFPRVVVDIWADPLRDASTGSVLEDDAADKAFRVYHEVRKVLHRIDRSGPGGSSIYFGDLRISSSVAADEPELHKVTDGNGAKMLRCVFNITY